MRWCGGRARGDEAIALHQLPEAAPSGTVGVLGNPYSDRWDLIEFAARE